MGEERWCELTEHGLWCPACGYHVATARMVEDGYTPPFACKNCGYPEFEDGTGYFTDDAP